MLWSLYMQDFICLLIGHYNYGDKLPDQAGSFKHQSYPKSTQLIYIINISANNNSWMKIAEILIVLKSAPPVGSGNFVVDVDSDGLGVVISLDVSALFTDIPSLLAYRK